MIAVALDADEAAVREWATKEPMSMPILIDKYHIVADLYGIVNVPSSVGRRRLKNCSPCRQRSG